MDAFTIGFLAGLSPLIALLLGGFGGVIFEEISEYRHNKLLERLELETAFLMKKRDIERAQWEALLKERDSYLSIGRLPFIEDK